MERTLSFDVQTTNEDGSKKYSNKNRKPTREKIIKKKHAKRSSRHYLIGHIHKRNFVMGFIYRFFYLNLWLSEKKIQSIRILTAQQ